MTRTTISHHWFRRTARKHKNRCEHTDMTGARYTVEKARRGPFLWTVVKYTEDPTF